MLKALNIEKIKINFTKKKLIQGLKIKIGC